MELVTCLRFSLLGFLVTSFLLQGIEAGPCPENWFEEGDSCFGLFPKKSWFSVAMVNCLLNDSRLAHFQTQAEWDNVAKHIIANFKDVDDIWVGLRIPPGKTEWLWADDTPVSFSPWNTGEPNNEGGNKGCAHTTKENGFTKLNASICDTKVSKAYLCKTKKKQ